ncbi:MAG: hypothetical protein ACXVAY_02040 [Mucilaginibacter sp.]
MNKTIFKSTNTRILLCCGFLIFTAIIIHSCKKDNKNQLQDTDITDPNVLAAQAWYNTSYPASAATSTSTTQATQSTGAQQATTDWSKIISPYWSKAAAFTSKKGLNIVEAPALKKGDMAFARSMPANLSKYDFSQSGSLTSMLILKQGTQYAAYAMTIMGDSSYIKGDYSKLANNTYRKKDKDFTGWVLYHQLNGTFVNGWRYVNGKVTAAAHYNPGTGTSTQAVQSISSPKVNVLQTCEITIVWHIFSLCSYAISDVTLSNPQDCTYIARFAGAYSTCSDVPVNNPGGDPSAPPPTLPPCVPQGGGSTAPAAVNGKTTLALKANRQTILVAQPPDPPPTDPNGEIVPVLLCPVNVTTVDTIKIDTTKNPCSLANILAKSIPFTGLLGALQQVTNANNEVGYTYSINSDGSNMAATGPFYGPANADSIAIPFSAPIDGIVHTHFAGGFTTFSPADIQQLYQIMQGGFMNNASTFTMAVVTSTGSYLLKISDATKFSAFGAANLTPSSFNAFENGYLGSYSIASLNNNTSASYELALLTALNNSGLTVFKGNSTVTSWTPIIKQNNQVTNTTCN